MKLLRSYLAQAFLFVAAVLAMQSCSCNKLDTVENKLTEIAPDDAEFIVVGDMQRVLSALEVKVEDGSIVLPEYFADFASAIGESRDFDNASDQITSAKTGIDYTNIVAVFKNTISQRPDGVICFNIDDLDDFYSFMTDIDDDIAKGESGDYQTVGDENASILVKGHDAFFVIKNGRPLADDDAVSALDKWIEKAQSKPLADWKLKYLSEPAAAAALFSLKDAAGMVKSFADEETAQALRYSESELGVSLEDMTVVARFDLAGPTAKASMSILDKSGNPVKNPFAAKFDTDLLKYTTDSDILVAGLAINREAIDKIAETFNKELDKEKKHYQDQIDYYNSYYYDYYSYDIMYYSQLLQQIREIQSVVNDVANSLEGNAMMAVGYNPLKISSVSDITRGNANPYERMHVVVAAKCVPSAGHKIFETVCQSLAAAMGYQGYPDLTGNKCTLANGSMKTYIELDGDNIVISNLPIATNKGSNFDSSMFDNKYVAAQLSIPANLQPIKSYDLPCGLLVNVSGQDLSFDVEVTLTDTKQNIIPALFKIITAMAKS